MIFNIFGVCLIFNPSRQTPRSIFFVYSGVIDASESIPLCFYVISTNWQPILIGVHTRAQPTGWLLPAERME